MAVQNIGAWWSKTSVGIKLGVGALALGSVLAGGTSAFASSPVQDYAIKKLYEYEELSANIKLDWAKVSQGRSRTYPAKRVACVVGTVSGKAVGFTLKVTAPFVVIVELNEAGAPVAASTSVVKGRKSDYSNYWGHIYEDNCPVNDREMEKCVLSNSIPSCYGIQPAAFKLEEMK